MQVYVFAYCSSVSVAKHIRVYTYTYFYCSRILNHTLPAHRSHDSNTDAGEVSVRVGVEEEVCMHGLQCFRCL